MNIKSMLLRLESAMGRQDLTEQMLLVSTPASSSEERDQFTKSVNLIVGYNRSPSSQTALDLTLWIAHQTRLVTKAQVTVQVVYVLDSELPTKSSDIVNSTPHLPLEFAESSALRSPTPVLTQPSQMAMATPPRVTSIEPSYLRATFYQDNHLEQANRILSQARSLAEEWRGSFKAHLRFGCVAAELRKVVESEAAALLFLGCTSANHPLVQRLGADFPCPVLGIPSDCHQED